MTDFKYDPGHRRRKQSLENGFSLLTFLQVLDETDFATQAKWDVTGKFAKADPVTLIFATGDLNGTLIQTIANMVSALAANTTYAYTYVVGVSTAPDGDFTLTLTGGFVDIAGSATSVTLPFTAGAHTVYFRTGDTPADFTITALETTATQGSLTFDDFSVSGALDADLAAAETEWHRIVALGSTATLSGVSSAPGGDDLPSVTLLQAEPLDARLSQITLTAGTIAAYRL